MKIYVHITRISKQEYSFKLSNRDGLRYVARVLTFKNPNFFVKNRKIEMFDKRAFTFRIGMLPTLIQNLQEDDIEYKIEDYDYQLPKSVKIDDRMSGNYIHQRRAVEAFFKRRFGIIQVPTRGGKTFIASEIARIFLETDNGDFLFLTDNTTLHTQAVNDLHKYFERYGGIEIGEIKAGKIDTSHRITVGMIQTIQTTLSKRCTDKVKQRTLKKYLKELKFLCVDEIHDNCSDSKLKLYKKECCSIEYQLCLSATPYRSEAFVQNLKLIAWSGDVVYEISEETLRKRKVLSDYQVFILFLDHNKIDYGEVIEEYGELRKHMIFHSEKRNGCLMKLISMFQSKELKTLVLFQSKEHGRIVSKLTGYTFIDGDTKNEEREKRKQEFLQEQGGVLMASNIFKKGVTLPEVQVLINADEGLEDANTIQRKGRVLGATERKTKSLIIDFFDLYDLYFSEHSETRLQTYIESIGENNVTILDMFQRDWLKDISGLTDKWFDL